MIKPHNDMSFSRVAVLRPVPAGVSVGATRTLELGGARRGGGGDGGEGRKRKGLPQHSLLSSLEECTPQVAGHGLVSTYIERWGGREGL